MKHLVLTLLAILFTSSGRVLAQERALENAHLGSALGPVVETKNSKGVPCYDFSRGRHDLRLEDIVTNGTPLSTGCKITGSFTLTHLYYDPTKTFLRQKSDHIYATYKAENGKLEIDLTHGEGGSPALLLLELGSLAAGAPPQAAKVGGDFVKKLEKVCAGDAKDAMTSVIKALGDKLTSISSEKLP